MEHVIIGLSGGVDSAVAAAQIVQQGYSAEGLFMKNWEEDSHYCTSEEDYKDALQICELLGIPLRSVNFSKEYWDKVFKHFLNEYKLGRTPNPDILCNTEIKFKTFLDYAKKMGADKIATGHYARILRGNKSLRLARGIDQKKDQSYFLYGLNQKQLSQAVFPIGDSDKMTVRQKAKELGFHNHCKKDSTGICFIGERHFKEFLQRYLPAQPGDIINQEGKPVGQHEGLMYYTMGQRQGLGIGGGHGTLEKPWYVLDKDIKKNTLIVGQGNDHPSLYHRSLSCSHIHWISGKIPESKVLTAKIRYRAPDVPCKIKVTSEQSISVVFEKPQFAIAPGQSIVFYGQDICLGGAIIDSRWN
jgi:tRNA-specific 2-thiouridylase